MTKNKSVKPPPAATPVQDILDQVEQTASEKLASGGVVLSLGERSSITDYFCIFSCRNDRQIKALAGALEETLKARFGLKPFHIDGMPECQWVVMDYGNFIIHLFHESLRHVYDLEGLWQAHATA